MISPCYPQSTARESDDGDQLQGSPFPQGHHSHGGTVVRGLSLELPACGRTPGGARRPGRPRDHPALGGEIQSLIGGGVSSSEAVGMGQLADGSVPDATGKNALVPPQALCVDAGPPEGWSQKGAG